MPLWGHQVFREVIKLKQGHWSGLLLDLTGVLVKRGNLEPETDTHTEGRPREDLEGESQGTMEDWSDASGSQRDAWGYRSYKGTKQILPRPQCHLIWDF